jgi:ferritin
MISKKMQDLINKQINMEIGSAYIYYSMSAWAQDQDLPGLANWMRIQALEELTHGDKFFHYMVERGARVVMDKIDKPQTEWKTPVAVMETTLGHENKVTASINALVTQARKENDHATDNFLQWFVAEQVEEEANATALLKQFKMLEKAPGGVYMLDKELAARVFVPPVAAAK